MALTDKLKAIADAIRDKNGETGIMTLDEMPLKIEEIKSGGATEPYIEETYDSDYNLIVSKMVGHTKVRKNAFYECTKLALTELPSGITSIGERVFSGCSKLVLTELPAGITSIGAHAFSSCPELVLTELPAGVTSIGEHAFSYCSKLALTELPAGITSIWKRAFSSCINLTSITFKGKPTGISSSAFDSCDNLTTINVPWAKGEVPNAPWGATKATINYNYVAPEP